MDNDLHLVSWNVSGLIRWPLFSRSIFTETKGMASFILCIHYWKVILYVKESLISVVNFSFVDTGATPIKSTFRFHFFLVSVNGSSLYSVSSVRLLFSYIAHADLVGLISLFAHIQPVRLINRLIHISINPSSKHINPDKPASTQESVKC